MGGRIKMERVIIQLPTPLKAKLNALRKRGYTASGYIRTLLERELAKTAGTRRKRKPE